MGKPIIIFPENGSSEKAQDAQRERVAVTEGGRLAWKGPGLAVHLMEGQSAEIANPVPMCKHQLSYHLSCLF